MCPHTPWLPCGYAQPVSMTHGRHGILNVVGVSCGHIIPWCDSDSEAFLMPAQVETIGLVPHVVLLLRDSWGSPGMGP